MKYLRANIILGSLPWLFYWEKNYKVLNFRLVSTYTTGNLFKYFSHFLFLFLLRKLNEHNSQVRKIMQGELITFLIVRLFILFNKAS